jgi:hypothetical protein
MDSLKLPGSKLNYLIQSFGFTDQAGKMIGAALEKKMTENVGAGSNLYDVFSPLSNGNFDRIRNGLAPFGFIPNYFKRVVDQANVNRYTTGLLNRCYNPQNMNAVIQNLTASLVNRGLNPNLNQNLSLDQQLGQLLQQSLVSLQQQIQNKLNTMNPPMVKKKKKKKGIGGKLKKLKKGFKKIGKMAKGITKIGKRLFKGVLTSVKGLFSGGLLTGFTGIFQLGGSLLGGLAGGPIGSKLIAQIAGKKNVAKFSKIFEQMNKMFGVIGNIQAGMNQFHLQNLSKRIHI